MPYSASTRNDESSSGAIPARRAFAAAGDGRSTGWSNGDDRVAERPEDVNAARQEDVAVGVLVADRRAPDHEHRLVGRAAGIDDVPRQPVTHRRQRAGDGAHQHVAVGVGEDGVEDLATAPVG
jgi:hypothetical protein